MNGRLSMDEFALGLSAALDGEWPPVQELVVVVRNDENAGILRRRLAMA